MNETSVLIAVITVGIALAGLILTTTRGMETRLNARIDGLEARIASLEGQFAELRERMAHLEGVLEGLREAITGRAVTR